MLAEILVQEAQSDGLRVQQGAGCVAEAGICPSRMMED